MQLVAQIDHHHDHSRLAFESRKPDFVVVKPVMMAELCLVPHLLRCQYMLDQEHARIGLQEELKAALFSPAAASWWNEPYGLLSSSSHILSSVPVPTNAAVENQDGTPSLMVKSVSLR